MPRRKKDPEPEERDDFHEVVHGEHLESLEEFVKKLSTAFAKEITVE